MDTLPDSLLLQILSRLDDSADVARCRAASKAFNSVFPGLRSINLKWYVLNSSSQQPFKEVFVNLISKLKAVESVCIGHQIPFIRSAGSETSNDLNLVDGDFAKECLPRVSESLKSLSISGLRSRTQRQSNVLILISQYCHNLVNLKLKYAWLSMNNLNPMPMLTSLTLSFTNLEDEELNELNKCFPDLQVLNLVSVRGLKDPKIRLLNLKACHWAIYNHSPSLTLITPNLITLKIETLLPTAIHVEAPKLTHFHLSINGLKHAGAFTAKVFENLKTFFLDTSYVGSLLSEFPIAKTVETLTLESGNEAPRDARDLLLTLTKVVMVFPNVRFLCIKPNAWLELEACLNPEGWEILDGRKGLKTICAYLTLVDSSLTFSSVAFVLDQCVDLSEVSLLISADVVDAESKSFMSKCVARCPGMKWRWGIWGEDMEDSWITDDMPN
ncbi:F-box/LRR-repeat protein At4g29420-like [Bidens hawaiensis]|uniref:F-box/LRR-repeat protein At4g29420-like n=1 Tax=Bidens hawaiensis TaxID=980011 RepID=UPI00404B1DD5